MLQGTMSQDKFYWHQKKFGLYQKEVHERLTIIYSTSTFIISLAQGFPNYLAKQFLCILLFS